MYNLQSTIRVMLVDDHEMVRAALSISLLIYEDVEVVAEARNGQEAVYFSVHAQPDVIVMDLLMPMMDGITAMKEILRQNPEVGILILSSSSEEGHREAAYQAGAKAYLTKNIRTEELVHIIRQVYHQNSDLKH